MKVSSNVIEWCVICNLMDFVLISIVRFGLDLNYLCSPCCCYFTYAHVVGYYTYTYHLIHTITLLMPLTPVGYPSHTHLSWYKGHFQTSIITNRVAFRCLPLPSASYPYLLSSLCQLISPRSR